MQISNTALIDGSETNTVLCNVLGYTKVKYQNGTKEDIELTIGDYITYTIVVTNISSSKLLELPFIDVLDLGSEFVNGSFTIDGEVQGDDKYDEATRTLSATIHELQSKESTTFEFKVLITG